MRKIKKEIRYQGESVSKGIAIGPIYIYDDIYTDFGQQKISSSIIKNEIELFYYSVLGIKKKLRKNLKQSSKLHGELPSQIFSAQIAILEDSIFLKEVEMEIKESSITAEFAVNKVFDKKKDFFLSQENEYFRDRAYDIIDLKRLLIKKIRGDLHSHKLLKASIIVAKIISPSDIIHFERNNILGLITKYGGKTSHSSIIARSLNIPSIMGVDYISLGVANEQEAILDGNKGDILINPTSETLTYYLFQRDKYEKYMRNLSRYRDSKPELADGTQVTFSANIEFVEDIFYMKKYGLSEVGLYRSEGYFLKHDIIPNEEIQTKEYLKISEELGDTTVIIRVLDVGGDKVSSDFDIQNEANPFLGWRAIRFCLEEKKIFKMQLRAILRASAKSRFKILLPLVINLSEIRCTRDILKEVMQELRNEGFMFDENIQIGIMIETPASALLIASYIKEVDFVSIGTNDLIQYILAVDRGNEKVSHLYQAHHPAVLHILKKVIDVCEEYGKPAQMCGEMASEPIYFPLLLGMGLRRFSMIPRKVLELRKMMEHLTLLECEKLYQNVEKKYSYEEIDLEIRHWFQEKFSDLVLE